ncbi:GerMN domain-containing protein [Paenibacillus zanthoxyli]|uniref:GerMN domain-containing protein n=1 Tax=Paenibacillus zanthoxyli TaxID=369399 RepID=UPI00046E73A8|nr:GerMN domain-containing protein [Paenibacillus zanthoxyli]
MWNKKMGIIGIASALLLVLAGCGDKPSTAPANEGGIASPAVVSGAEGNVEASEQPVESTVPDSSAQPTAENESPSVEPSLSAAPPEEKKSQTIDVYYADSQMTDLKPAKADIAYKDDTEKYTEAFKSLQKSDNTDLIPLWGKMELKSLKFENGQIVMDIHKPAEAQLGAGGESFALSALTKTLFQFSEVQSIELLVDGEQVESLMGHADLLHPMTRENSQ